jgi:hypothetical protein
VNDGWRDDLFFRGVFPAAGVSLPPGVFAAGCVGPSFVEPGCWCATVFGAGLGARCDTREEAMRFVQGMTDPKKGYFRP